MSEASPSGITPACANWHLDQPISSWATATSIAPGAAGVLSVEWHLSRVRRHVLLPSGLKSGTGLSHRSSCPGLTGLAATKSPTVPQKAPTWGQAAPAMEEGEAESPVPALLVLPAGHACSGIHSSLGREMG